MRNRLLIVSLSLGVLTVGSLLLGQNTKQDPQVNHDANPGQCSGKASDCKKPAKFLSKEGDCICYTCEVGTENQKAVCTINKNEAKMLGEKERETEEENRNRNSPQHPPMSQ